MEVIQGYEGLQLHSVQNTTEHKQILYSLLKERIYSISHISLPDYSEHDIFVSSSPYRYWYLIDYFEKYIGAVYIQYDNSIGLNLSKGFEEMGKPVINLILTFLRPLPAVKSSRSQFFSMNISPDNLKLQQSAKLAGGKLVQYSYIFPKP